MKMWQRILCVVISCFLTTVLCDSEVTYSGPRYVEEGSTFTIECLQSSSYILKWTKNNKTIDSPEYNMTMDDSKGVSGRISYNLTVRNAQANHSGEYRCNRFTSGEFHEISVIFDIEGHNTVELNLNDDTTLHCNISQDSSVKIAWMKNGAAIVFPQPKYLEGNSSLTIVAGTYADAGTYVCAVGRDFTKNITFSVKTRVRVEKFEKSINAVQGDRLVLTCKCYGNPTPTVTWFKDNVSIKDSNLTQHIKIQEANNVSDSEMVIEHLEENDRAVYRCNVANDINEANVTVMVRVKDKLAALWPFLGILAEVAVLCTIIFIYEKRRAKQEYDESDTDPNNESKPSTEQKKEDVRQRK